MKADLEAKRAMELRYYVKIAAEQQKVLDQALAAALAERQRQEEVAWTDHVAHASDGLGAFLARIKALQHDCDRAVAEAYMAHDQCVMAAYSRVEAVTGRPKPKAEETVGQTTDESNTRD